MTEIRKCSELWCINEQIITNLTAAGMEEYFPVQMAVIPLLLNFNSMASVIPRDLCISAPTGSGKTLAYAVPIASLLSNRLMTRLRALIILPSRELAMQVFGVLCTIVRGLDLKIINCIGQTDFYEEQQLLVGPFCDEKDILMNFSNNYMYSARDSPFGASNVDVMVCTPGRLIEHLQNTKGFTLQHLKFLVLDEADRLLGNAYHYWVKRVIESTQDGLSNKTAGWDNTNFGGKRKRAAQGNEEARNKASVKPPMQRLLFSATLTDNPAKLALLGIKNPIVLKIGSVPSESVNKDGEDPEKAVENEGLGSDSVKGFTLPPTLKEFIRICDTTVRPLHLIGILVEAVNSELSKFDIESHAAIEGTDIFSRGICAGETDMCIVFTSSVEATHRLSVLLQIVNGQRNDEITKFEDFNPAQTLPGYLSAFKGRVAEMSRLMSAAEREVIMRDAKRGDIKVLVSSDHMARGIDLPNVQLVINYDHPKFSETYVHRVGRTARANKTGHCITLLKNGQSGTFRKMRAEIGCTAATSKADLALGKCKISKATIENCSGIYEFSLSNLKHFIED